MPLAVVSFSTYLTSIGDSWRSSDYDAHDFIDAIKDRDINGYAHVRLRGTRHRFDNTNRQEVVGWFATMVADYFEKAPIDRPFVLVPVPGSKVDLAYTEVPRTTQLAEVVARALGEGVTVMDALRWRTAMPSANAQGGTRDPARLFENLAITGKLEGSNVVLVDDVLTSGGHLQACAAKVLKGGANLVIAVCAGRADQQQQVDPFAVRLEEIADFTP
jgi:predicted amidophosphoribosyltransferase